jgi:type VI secretion system protein ImpK
MATIAPPVAAAGPTASGRTENLALVYQDVLTVIVRLRSNRQAVSHAESFRANMRSALRKAEQDAAARGYAGEEIQHASFAVVAFLDESVLNSRNPSFAEWVRRPLQEELFGGHVAGEVFFQRLNTLLAAKESTRLADILEVYELCLLLGYRGRYSLSGDESLRALKASVAEKISRIRGPIHPLSTLWAALINAPAPVRSDPWLRRLVIAAAACLLLALILFIGYRVSLGSGLSEVRNFAFETGSR